MGLGVRVFEEEGTQCGVGLWGCKFLGEGERGSENGVVKRRRGVLGWRVLVLRVEYISFPNIPLRLLQKRD